MAMVEDSFVWFKGLVAERRKLSVERTAILADGRVYTGRQALKEGLIDALGGEDEAVKWLESEKKITKDLPIFDRKPPQEATDSFFGVSATTTLLRLLGFSQFETAAQSAQLNGLLVLWHPQL